MTRVRRALLVAALGVIAFSASAISAHALWSASATATMTVSTATSLTLSCDSKSGNDAYTVTWSSVSGADHYTVYGAGENVETADTTFDVRMDENGTMYVRVTASDESGAESGFSNTLQITRTTPGNGQGKGAQFECGPVSP